MEEADYYVGYHWMAESSKPLSFEIASNVWPATRGKVGRLKQKPLWLQDFHFNFPKRFLPLPRRNVES